MDLDQSKTLESELTTVLARLEPAQSARVWVEIAENLADALARQTRPEVWHALASTLGRLSAKLDPADAARVCGQAARTLDRRAGAGIESRCLAGNGGGS